MTSQGIMSSVANKLFGSMYCAESATSYKSSSASDKTASSFEGMIKQSRTKTEYRETKEINSESTEQRQNTDNAVKTVEPGKTGREDDIRTRAVERTKETVADKETDIPEEDARDMIANLVQVIENIVSILQDTLEIDNREMNAVMSDMGIGFMDLLNQDNLKQFSLLSICQGDITAALTDEGLADKLYSVLEQVQEVISDFEALGVNVEDTVAFTEQTEMSSELMDRMNQMLANDGTKSFLNISEQTDTVTEDATKTESMADDVVTDAVMMNQKSASDSNNNTDDLNNWSSEADLNDENQITSKHADSRSITVNEFIENLVEARLSGDTIVNGDLAQNVTFRDIAYQVIEQVKVTVAEGQTSMQMVLSPESLGRVELNIVSKDGIMPAQLTTQTQVAKEAIESQIVTLQESLDNQGLKVDAIEVTVSDFHFGQSDGTNEQQGNPKKGHRNSFKSEGIITEDVAVSDDSLMESVMELNGHTVSYTA